MTARGIIAGLVAIALIPVGLIELENILLNLAVPHLLNRRPERLRVDFSSAWMIIPGHVHIRDLRIRNQSPTDQWVIAADSVSGVISLPELLDRELHASEVRAMGMTIRMRRRVDAEPIVTSVEPGPEDLPARVEASNAPPIEGLKNPPDPDPDDIYPPRGNPWLVALDDIQADGVREIWVGDYRLTGDASVAANLWIAGPYMDIDGAVTLHQMRAGIGDAPVAENVHGVVTILVDSMDRDNKGADKFRSITADARVSADVMDLRFVDFYLAAVPWLSLAGVGHLEADVGLVDGEFRDGSTFTATFPELVVRLLGNDIAGAGEIHGAIGSDADNQPESQLDVTFDDFAITPDGSTGALVEGTGFHIAARSPDITLDEPFTSVEVNVDLPESRIPDVATYSAFLPEGVGLSLRDGTGTVRAQMTASSRSGGASGDLYVDGDDVVLQFDAIAMTGDVALHARLADARPGTGWYELSGTTLDLRRVGLIDRDHADEHDGERKWSASIVLPSGVVQVGAPVYLDTTVAMTASDSVPFVTIFADQKSLPGWVQGLLSVPDVSGKARLQLGTNTVEIAPCVVRAGGFQVDLQFRREGLTSRGDLLAQAGPLACGIALREGGPQIKVFGAKKWFEEQPPISSR